MLVAQSPGVITQGSTTSFEDVLLAPNALRTLFQPIVRHDENAGPVHALECLTRGPRGSVFHEAVRLFDEARRTHREAEVDRACVATAIETTRRCGISHDLFLNVHPATLITDPSFPRFVVTTAEANGVARERLMIEVTEHDRAADPDGLIAALRALPRLGLRFAFDDFGATPADRRLLQAYPPSWIKLDGHLFQQARQWRSVRSFVAAHVTLARRCGAGVIAEGLERPDDLLIAEQLGIAFLQGHLFSRPLAGEAAARIDFTLTRLQAS